VEGALQWLKRDAFCSNLPIDLPMALYAHLMWRRLQAAAESGRSVVVTGMSNLGYSKARTQILNPEKKLAVVETPSLFQLFPCQLGGTGQPTPCHRFWTRASQPVRNTYPCVTMATDRLNLRRMIHLDEVESMLMSLMDTVDRQTKEIDDLKRICQGFLHAQTAQEKFTALERSVDEVHAYVKVVQDAATARLPDDRTLPCGELAAHTHLQVEELRRAVADLCPRSELRSAVEMVTAAQAADVRALRDWAAPLDVAVALQGALRDAAQRVTAVEGAVAGKVGLGFMRRPRA